MLLQQEGLIRLGCFLGLLLLFAGLERLLPRRRQGKWSERRFSNLALAALNTAVVRFLVPVTAVSTALLAEQHGWGLLAGLPLPGWLTFVLAMVLLDAAIYFQHVLFHAVPVLWRLHRVHHADHEMDVTTGVRFHAVEIVLSALLKIAVVGMLGPPAAAVVLFEVILNASSLFNHSNVRLPQLVDRVLRFVLVTPDMHRVHHSINPAEANSNFGFNLPWWDYLAGTYRAQPAAGHAAMRLGIAELGSIRDESLPVLLIMPFLASTTQRAAETPGSPASGPAVRASA